MEKHLHVMENAAPQKKAGTALEVRQTLLGIQALLYNVSVIWNKLPHSLGLSFPTYEMKLTSS